MRKTNFFAKLSPRMIIPTLLLFSLLGLLCRKSALGNRVFFERYSMFSSITFILMLINFLIIFFMATSLKRWERLRNSFNDSWLLMLGIGAIGYFFLDCINYIFIHTATSYAYICYGLFVITALLVVLCISQKTKQDLINIFLLMLSMIVSLIFLENLFLRVLAEQKSPIINKNQFEKYVASSWPHPVPLSKKKETVRILGLADSFGVSGGEKNYHYLLEKSLNKKNKSFEVVNFSVPEFEPNDELLLFEKFGKEYDPDIVLYGFFVGNDFNPTTSKLFTWRKISVRWGWESFNLIRPAINFAVLGWIKRFLIMSSDKRCKFKEPPPYGTFSKHGFLRLEFARKSICNSTMNYDEIFPVLKKIINKTNEIGAKFVMVIHPDQFQVDSNLKNKIGLDSNCAAPQEALISFARKETVPVLDLRDDFLKENIKQDLYLLHDTHYSEAGNILAAKKVEDFLINNKLI